MLRGFCREDGVGLFVLIMVMGWSAMRFYDTPVRGLLTKKMFK